MLSGEVKIREQQVVSWEAEYRREAEAEGYSIYRVRARGYYEGVKYDKVFDVAHNRNHGPYVLTSIIMVEIGIQLGG